MTTHSIYYTSETDISNTLCQIMGVNARDKPISGI